MSLTAPRIWPWCRVERRGWEEPKEKLIDTPLARAELSWLSVALGGRPAVVLLPRQTIGETA